MRRRPPKFFSPVSQGMVLKKYMKLHDYNTRTLSEKLGMSASTVRNWSLQESPSTNKQMKELLPVFGLEFMKETWPWITPSLAHSELQEKQNAEKDLALGRKDDVIRQQTFQINWLQGMLKDKFFSWGNVAEG
ncbi:MAG: hypothetical protein SH856_13785 [Flavobacteriales bacterium]|nr:hypothetical protein [Flavobacteriales bacterium]